ncbi:MAG: A24 family peptidase [Sneathiellales bacterium]|nr:A24 family peptidase [Sneathiellales bacterium]
MTYFVLFCLLGLAVGSFLNVVIYRLPKIEQAEEKLSIRQWLVDRNIKFKDTKDQLDPGSPMTLSLPRSSCPSCGHVIKPYENIPILSYLFQRGKCNGCGSRISVRYPIIEALTAFLFFLVYLEFGFSLQSLAAGAFVALIVTLSAIDFDEQILPDCLNYLLLWSGLLVAAFGLFVPASEAIIGAITAYGALWIIFQIHHRITGRIGMGYGDFKLFAALAVWVGWQQLPILLLIAASTGIVYFIFLKISGKVTSHAAFGPFLALGGFICLLYGPQIQLYIYQATRS